jgi:hypothetical protein
MGHHSSNVKGTQAMQFKIRAAKPLAIMLALCFGPALRPAPATSQPGSQQTIPTQVSFRDMNSVVYLTSPDIVRELGVGWTRQGFYWQNVESKKGQWTWTGLDNFVVAAHAQGVEVLPLLAYTASWAADGPNPGFSPPKREEEWEDYVEHVVARYSKPPYNLRYFQVWNEPTRLAGFWTGSDEDFIDKVYIPAAKIVRSHGGRVVFGGWPDSNSLQEFDRVLRYHDAWRWTDILDVHYEGLSAFQYLYDRWVKTGKCRGIWETEIGFTQDPDFVPANYLTILHWALVAGWSDPDQYKLFWYAAWGAGPDGPKCLATTDASGKIVLSAQGRQLAVINGVLGSGTLSAFPGFSVEVSGAKLTARFGSAFGFSAGSRIVLALFLNASSLKPQDSLSIFLPGVLHAKMRLVTSEGSELKFKPTFQGSGLRAAISLREPLATTGLAKSVVLYFTAEPEKASGAAP